MISYCFYKRKKGIRKVKITYDLHHRQHPEKKTNMHYFILFIHIHKCRGGGAVG